MTETVRDLWHDRETVEQSSRIVPWTIHSIDRHDIDFWYGRFVEEIMAVTIDSFVENLRQ